MHENIICMICAGIALVAMLAYSFWMAYKAVHKQPTCCHIPTSEGDVSLDAIAEDYLKLTNLT